MQLSAGFLRDLARFLDKADDIEWDDLVEIKAGTDPYYEIKVEPVRGQGFTVYAVDKNEFDVSSTDILPQYQSPDWAFFDAWPWDDD